MQVARVGPIVAPVDLKQIAAIIGADESTRPLHGAAWSADVSGAGQPTPMSEVYQIRIEYGPGDVPKAHVVRSRLRIKDLVASARRMCSTFSAHLAV